MNIDKFTDDRLDDLESKLLVFAFTGDDSE
jgi:hypothetical protein